MYIIPYSSEVKYNIYGKKHPSVSRKKEMADKKYCNELPLKFKKHFENFEVYYNDEKPALNPPFSTGYFCHKILPQQICFEEINKKDCICVC